MGRCPIPMGDSRVACCSQGGGVSVHYAYSPVTITLSSIYGNTANGVKAHIYNFPLPPCETHVLLVVCREAVSMSILIQTSRLRLPRSVGIVLKMCALIFRSSHCPMRKWLTFLISILVCTIAADALVNYSKMYVPQSRFPPHMGDSRLLVVYRAAVSLSSVAR
jgi:hypothetical protein